MASHRTGGADVGTVLDLSAGPVEVEDTGGDGPVVVLLHGVMMDHRQWSAVVEQLRTSYRCVLPTLPLGAHRRPTRPGADLSLRGQARLVSEVLEGLELQDVTLCFNDWAAPQVMVADGLTDRVAAMVLVSCETAGNYPPGLPGRTLALLGRTPGGLTVALHALRLRWARRLPTTFGRMARYGVPDDLVDAWISPALSSRAVLRDLGRYVRSTRSGKRDLVDATAMLSRFDRPVLVAWGAADRVMPREEGRRLAAAFPQGRFTTVPDAGTLVPLDQPAALATLIDDHARFAAALGD
jgi:pimeloyl-ACP methyl ester carboxylesterase